MGNEGPKYSIMSKASVDAKDRSKLKDKKPGPGEYQVNNTLLKGK